MDLLDYLKREVIRKASRYGLVLTPEALDYILFNVKDVDSLFSSLSRQGLTFIRLEDLSGEPVAERVEEGDREEEEVFEPRRCEARFRVKLHVDPEEIEPASWERERREILLQRLEILGDLLRARGNVAPVDYTRALRSSEERDILGIVLSIDATSNGKLILRLENEEDSVDVLVPQERTLLRKVSFLSGDAVVALRVISRNNRLILRDVFFPGSIPHAPPCDLKILVVPEPWKNEIPEVEADAVVLLSNVVNVYSSTDIKRSYREVDERIATLEAPVFVVPGPLDATRVVPPRPPLEEDLFPESSSTADVHLLGSPAVIRTNGMDIVLSDGDYHQRSGQPVASVFRLLLVQADISSFPYRSSRDHSLLKRPPHYVLIPAGGSNHRAVGLREPYILSLSGKVIPLG